MFDDMYELKDLMNGVKRAPSFWVQAHFSLEGWLNLFDIPYEEAHAYESLYYGKRDNPELTYRLVNSETNEIISEADAIETYLGI